MYVFSFVFVRRRQAGCTSVVCLMVGKMLHVANAGDSRWVDALPQFVQPFHRTNDFVGAGHLLLLDECCRQDEPKPMFFRSKNVEIHIFLS